MSYRFWDDEDYAGPREVKGGIKSQAKRGTSSQSWWAKRWISLLESFGYSARLSRGRSYARKGQVLSIKIDKGWVTAEVQGSRQTPYEVSIRVKTLPNAAVKRLGKSLSKQAIFAASLLAGEMPGEIEEAFQDAKLSLFPSRRRDLSTDCSCPDFANPCKHIAAVYYLLGEEFDRDPFLIFKLRGIERDELTALMSEGKTESESPPLPNGDEEPQPELLPADPKEFWRSGPTEFLDQLAEADEALIPKTSASLPKSLGAFPFWRGREPFLTWLEPIYEQVSEVGQEIFLKAGDGEPPG